MLLRVLALPITAPATALLFVAQRIEEQAMREHTDPAALKRELDRLEQALLDGDIDEATYDRLEDVLLQRLSEAPSWRQGSDAG